MNKAATFVYLPIGFHNLKAFSNEIQVPKVFTKGKVTSIVLGCSSSCIPLCKILNHCLPMLRRLLIIYGATWLCVSISESWPGTYGLIGSDLLT